MPRFRPRLTLVSHALCPFVQRAAIALAEKNVPFERLNVDLTNKPEWFLAISPLGKVPLLRVTEEDGSEAVLFESNVICEYLEETQPGVRLHPTNAVERALHRGWMEFGSAVAIDLYNFQMAKDPAAVATARGALTTKLKRLDDSLSGGPFFDGPFSFVDAVFAPLFRQMDVYEKYVPAADFFGDFAKVAAWRTALRDRPSVVAAAPADFEERMLSGMRDRNAFVLQKAA